VEVFAVAPNVRREIAVYLVSPWLIGLPVLFLGAWLGLRLYGRLDQSGFRRVILPVLLFAGLSPVVRLQLRDDDV
jgi:hypothetical protein